MFTKAGIFRLFASLCLGIRALNIYEENQWIQLGKLQGPPRKLYGTSIIRACPTRPIFMLKCFHLFLSYVHILPSQIEPCGYMIKILFNLWNRKTWVFTNGTESGVESDVGCFQMVPKNSSRRPEAFFVAYQLNYLGLKVLCWCGRRKNCCGNWTWFSCSGGTSDFGWCFRFFVSLVGGLLLDLK